jgi:hypothetical protein
MNVQPYCKLRTELGPGAIPSVVDERLIAFSHVLVAPLGEGHLSGLSLSLLGLRQVR